MTPVRVSKLFSSLVLRLTRSGLASVILGAGLILTLLTTYLAYDRALLGAQLRFQETTEEIRSHVETRLQVYLTSLKQARALFHLRRDADRDSFRILTEIAHPASEYPGLIGIGFVEAVHPADRADFDAKVRREYENPRLSLWQAANAKSDGEDWAIRFFEPETITAGGKSAVGYVIDGDPRVLETLNEARDTGRAALTRKITLPFDPLHKAAFILALPVYRAGASIDSTADRRRALRGFVFTAFDAKEFFEGPVSRAWLEARHVRFSVFEQEVAAEQIPAGVVPLYERVDFEAPSLFLRPFQTVLAVAPASHPLWLHIESVAGFVSPMDISGPWLLLLFGTLVSLLLFQILRTHAEHSSRLIKSERQLQLVTDALPVLISYVDLHERFLFINKSYESWFQTSREHLLGAEMRAVFSPKSYQNIAPYVAQALKGQSLSFETELILSGHVTRPVHVEYIPDFALDRSVKGFVALYSDVSERRKHEERSRFLVELSAVLGSSLEVEATLSRLATLLTPAVADWCLIDATDDAGFKRLIAHSHDPERRVLLRNLGSKLLPDDQMHLSQTVAQSGEPRLIDHPTPQMFVPLGPDYQTDADIVVTAGCASAMFVPLKARNHVLGTLTLVAAIPERRFSEDDLQFAVDIARRAALAIDNARLYREASQANRAKDEFLATLSHELRTPMNVILGWLELLTTEPFDEDTLKQALSTLTRNAGLQLQLINDLLDVSRIVNGKITLSVQRADLAQLIEGAVDGFQPAARAKNIQLEVDVLATETHIFGDANRLHQVLWNLLSNALKFTPEGGRINVRLESGDKSLKIIVADSGRGMDPHFLPYLFDRFRQEETGSSRSQGGLGLGLSIVRYLVELHGGSIEAQSRGRGQGSSFVLTLPQRPEVVQTPIVYKSIPAHNVSQPQKESPLQQLKGLRVLVVDDSSDVRTLVSRILTRAGCEVTLSEDAKSAWIQLEQSRPEVILSDLGLPHEDGLSLMKRWRAHEVATQKSRIPAAAMTGFVQADDARRTLEAGFDLHVAKPVTSADLLTALAKLKSMMNPAPRPNHEPSLEP